MAAPLGSSRGRPATSSAAPPVGPNGRAPSTIAVGSGFRAPVPAIPSFNAAPFAAPRPSKPSQPPPFDAERSATVQREFEQRAAASVRTAAAMAPSRGRPVLTVVLVVLAAAIAAISVYFVLPLLT
jgi:hypothetical protein